MANPIHVPSRGLRGSLCGPGVEPTPGIAPPPAPLPAGDVCPECARQHRHLAEAAARYHMRRDSRRPLTPQGGD